MGEELIYTIDVTNDGPYDTSEVRVMDFLPEEVIVSSASPSQGSCEVLSVDTVVCDLGKMAVKDLARVSIVAIPTKPGLIVNNASVRSAEFDPDLSNNESQASTSVE